MRLIHPRLVIGYRYLYLDDGYDNGATHAVELGGFAPTGRLRLGLTGELGVRDAGPDHDDVELRVTGHVGYRHPGRYQPHVSMVNTAGILVGTRFSVTETRSLVGFGIEAGIDAFATKGIYFGTAVGLLHLSAEDYAFNTFTFRLVLGH